MAVFWSTWLLTTQVKLTLGWLRSRLTDRVQELEGHPHITLCSSALSRPLLSEITFRSSVSPEAVHSRVALHQSGVMDVDPTRIWGEGTGSGVGGNKRIKLHICGKLYMPQFNIYYLIETKAYKEAL